MQTGLTFKSAFRMSILLGIIGVNPVGMPTAFSQPDLPDVQIVQEVEIEEAPAEVEVEVEQIKSTTAPKSNSASQGEKPLTPETSPSQKKVDPIKKYLDQIGRWEKERKARGIAPLILPKQRDDLLISLSNTYLGYTYTGSNGIRFIIIELELLNQTTKPIVIQQKDWKLIFDGNPEPFTEVDSKAKGYSYYFGQTSQSLHSVKFEEKLTVPPKKIQKLLLYRGNLPKGSDTPQLRISLKRGAQQQVLNVNSFNLCKLKMKTEQMGPHNALGIITLSGQLNTVNIIDVVQQIRSWTSQKVYRVVIHWEKTSQPNGKAPLHELDSQTLSWITTLARQVGRSRTNNVMFPMLPEELIEFHLSNIPGYNTTYSSSKATPIRIHKELGNAIGGALHTAYQQASSAEIVKSITEGHPMERVVALASGSEYLRDEHLPLILKQTQSSDVGMRKAALFALTSFSDSRALQKLIEVAKGKDKELQKLAATCLATSRFPEAQEALLKIVEETEGAERTKFLLILAQYPRPEWSTALYEFSDDRNLPTNLELVQTLIKIGHPRLVDLVKEVLKNKDEKLKEEMLQKLQNHSNPNLQNLLVDYSLEYMEKKPPTSAMISLLRRNQDQRAVPLLLKYLDEKPENSGTRSNVVSLLASIGDHKVMDLLIQKYPKLNDSEKSYILNALIAINSPRFREMAEQALLSKNSSLVQAACTGLHRDASSQSVRVLGEALEKTKSTSAWSYITNVLSAVGTPEARAILYKAQDSSNSSKRSYAKNAIRNLYQHTPAYSYLYRIKSSSTAKKWDDVIQLATSAMLMDPYLPELYERRGHAYLAKDNVDLAAADFKKAMEIDSHRPVALSSFALTKIRSKDVKGGIELIEKNRKKFEDQYVYFYNAACVYGRALESVSQEKGESKADLKKKYRNQAIKDLKVAVEKGYKNFSHMKSDPDLKSMTKDPEFIKIVEPAKEQERRAKEKAKAQQNANKQAVLLNRIVPFNP